MRLINRIFSYFYPSIVKQGTRYILRALFKHGMLNFSLTIHILPVGSTLSTVLQLEQFYINLLNPTYNILPMAGSSIGNPFSEENKQKFREERGERVYVYNADCTVLLYVFLSKTYMAAVLNIDGGTIRSFLDSGAVYLGSFVFKLAPLDPANASGQMTLDDFIALFVPLFTEADTARRKNLKHPAAVTVMATHIHDPSLSFSLPSLRKMAEHFGVDKSTIQSRLGTGAVFRGAWVFSVK